uniref:Fe2OG dioxygenase domain-containing protein n=1 Tax=Panagrellus redivivus TaxID=6233 RepID=A0A7E4V643_PANRE
MVAPAWWPYRTPPRDVLKNCNHFGNMKRNSNEEKSPSSKSIRLNSPSEGQQPCKIPMAEMATTMAPESPMPAPDNQNEQSASGYEVQAPAGSAMRAAFNRFKQRKSDLSDVLDLRVSEGSRTDESPIFECRPLLGDFEGLPEVCHGLRPYNEWTITTFPSRPGLFVINDAFEPSSHLNWLRSAIGEYSQPPNPTNVNLTGEAGEKYALEAVRWATLGFDYNWTTKEYPDVPRAPLPVEFTDVANCVTNAVGLGEFHADTAIVNYYPLKARLSPHVDRSERDHSQPLISLSFGQSAIYLTGGVSADDEVLPIMLHSGDILVMAGTQRLVFHAVPQVLKTRTFSPPVGLPSDADFTSVVAYANTHRINITLRRTLPS